MSITNIKESSSYEGIFPLEIIQEIASYDLALEAKLRQVCQTFSKMSMQTKISENDIGRFIRRFKEELSNPLSDKINVFKNNIKNFCPRIDYMNFEFMGSNPGLEFDRFQVFMEDFHLAAILGQIPECKRLTFDIMGAHTIHAFSKLNQLPKSEVARFGLMFYEEDPDYQLNYDANIFSNFWNLISHSQIKDIQVYFPSFDFQNYRNDELENSLSKTFENPFFNSLSLLFEDENESITNFKTKLTDLIDRKFHGFKVIKKALIGKSDFVWENSNIRDLNSSLPMDPDSETILNSITIVRGRKRKGEALEGDSTKKPKTTH